VKWCDQLIKGSSAGDNKGLDLLNQEVSPSSASPVEPLPLRGNGSPERWIQTRMTWHGIWQKIAKKDSTKK